MKNFDELYNDLFALEDPTDKYEWIIDYGGGGRGVDMADKNHTNLVRGCTSALWVVKYNEGIACESESLIVDGFASMICDWWNQASDEQQNSFSLDTLMNVGLAPLLSMGRQNGIANLIAKLKTL